MRYDHDEHTVVLTAHFVVAYTHRQVKSMRMVRLHRKPDVCECVQHINLFVSYTKQQRKKEKKNRKVQQQQKNERKVRVCLMNGSRYTYPTSTTTTITTTTTSTIAII